MQVLEQGAMTARGVMLYDVPPLYDLIVRPGPCEAFCRELANRAGGPILELACGSGHLTLPIAASGHAALSRERFLLVKSGNAGLCASRNFNGLATGTRPVDEPKTPFTC